MEGADAAGDALWGCRRHSACTPRAPPLLTRLPSSLGLEWPCPCLAAVLGVSRPSSVGAPRRGLPPQVVPPAPRPRLILQDGISDALPRAVVESVSPLPRVPGGLLPAAP